MILAINGVPVQGLTLDAIKGLTIGPEGSPVQVDFEFCIFILITKIQKSLINFFFY